MAELYRNLAIAMACVFITTFLLIANMLACSLVLLCVILTLVSCDFVYHSIDIYSIFFFGAIVMINEIFSRYASMVQCISGALPLTPFLA